MCRVVCVCAGVCVCVVCGVWCVRVSCVSCRCVVVQGEIVDETDVYVDHKKLQLAHMLRSLDAPLQRAIRTSIEMERRASLDRRERCVL
jgi:hypothetical protein